LGKDNQSLGIQRVDFNIQIDGMTIYLHYQEGQLLSLLSKETLKQKKLFLTDVICFTIVV